MAKNPESFWSRTDLATREAVSAWRDALARAGAPSPERSELLESAALNVQRGRWPEEDLAALGELGPGDFLAPIGAAASRRAERLAKVRTEGAPWLRCLLEFGFSQRAAAVAAGGRMGALLEDGFKALETGGYPSTLLPGFLPWRVLGLAGADKVFELAHSSGSSAEFLNSEDSEGRTIEESWMLSPRGSAEAGTLESRLAKARALGWDPNRPEAAEFGKNALWEAVRGLYSAEGLLAVVAAGADPRRPLRLGGGDAEWLVPAPKSAFGGTLSAALASRPEGRTMGLAEASDILAKQSWAPAECRVCAEILRAWEERDEIEASLGRSGGPASGPRL